MKVIPFELSVLNLVKRFFLAMFVGILGGVLGSLPIMVLVIPIVISAMLGLKFEWDTPMAKSRTLKPQSNSILKQAS